MSKIPLPTADASDLAEDKKCYLLYPNTINFKNYGGLKRFSGFIKCMKCYQDNTQVKAFASSNVTPSTGSGQPDSKDKTLPLFQLSEADKNLKAHQTILVIDGGGYENRALVGDNVASQLIKKGFNGVIVNGCVRDVGQLQEMPIGVLAIGTHPRRSMRNNNVTVVDDTSKTVLEFGSITWEDGQYVICDEDGVVVIPKNAVSRTLDLFNKSKL